ncbi:hypothetical protein [Roseisolibacter sp. H3M3-2]|uniref:hypothetical protein n=1 Tax=Roseisolibacter sp. H3M3-2 TaxID=3031323 RepID=UPI0023DBAB1B|nr:hypothetical protein [Roseisolibacter sp. H3M3-2]MDF1502878.1 hypothetical protein [Roseisolibacter sp. H3M3-2]
MTVPPSLPSWATPKPAAGPPAPDSPLDRQFAAFVGPRWPLYRRKFAPFFADARFQPTWNWSAALTVPVFGLWFLYRKLYLPFVFFTLAPGVLLSVLWGSDEIPMRQVPHPLDPNGPAVQLPTADFTLVGLGAVLTFVVLAGGTANFLLFRRATAAIRVVAPRSPDAEGALSLLRRIGGTSWRAVLIGFAVMLLLQLMSGQTAGR